MAKTALVTGGAGFIGCKLTPRLLARGFDVVVMDNLHPQVHTGHGLPAALPKDVRFVAGDVTQPSSWQTLLKLARPDVVVHLAAETGTGQSLTEAHRHAGVNVLGTAQLMDALSGAKLRPERVVVASSRAVYGDGAWADERGHVVYPGGRSHAALEAKQWDPRTADGGALRPLPSVAAETRPSPISVYAATKLAQEHLLEAWCRAFGVALDVLRLQNVYGPGQAVGNPYTGVLTFFATRALAKAPLEVFEDGQIIRDFVFVEDVADALAAAAGGTTPGWRTFDIGSGSATTILEVAQAMSRLVGGPAPVVSGRFRDGDVRAASCSIAAAQQALGFAPKVALADGLGRLLDGVAREKTP